MHTRLSRRQFLQHLPAAGLGLYTLDPLRLLAREPASPRTYRFADRRATRLPLVLTTWFPEVSREVGTCLDAGEYPLEAIERGIRRVERGFSCRENPLHDTVSVIVLDQRRDFWLGVSTSGIGGKLAVRVGDSPLLGAGYYIDNEVGAATGSGRGEELMRPVGARQVVENMRRGMKPAEACNEVLDRLLDRGHKDWVAFTAVNKEGEFGGVGMGEFTYYAYFDGITRANPSDKVRPLPRQHPLEQNYPNPFNA